MAANIIAGSTDQTRPPCGAPGETPREATRPGEVNDSSIACVGAPVRRAATNAGPEPDLEVLLETPLPQRLPVGRGTALFLAGRCSHPRDRIARLRVLVDEREVPVMAHGMHASATMSGGDCWWVIVPFEPRSSGRHAWLGLRATLNGGGEAFAHLGTVWLEPGSARSNGAAPPSRCRAQSRGDGRPASARPLIAVSMATYEPPPELFERQIESIRRQTYDNWVCVISDDHSRPEYLAEMRRIIGADPRFLLFPASERLGFYGNFERALQLAPPDASYIALSDQDDCWNPEKLQVLWEALDPEATIAYSDMRIVAPGGEVLSDTYWRYRRNNYEDFGSLLIANTITGAASLFSRRLLDYALPFPPRQGDAYHDHWIAVVAMALGTPRYVDRPLHDYVQHRESVIGHSGANAGRGRGRTPATDRALRLLRVLGRTARPKVRARYFEQLCRIMLVMRVLEMRCGEHMTPVKRQPLVELLSAEDSLRGAKWLALRAPRPLIGASETLGMERGLLLAIGWRRLAGLRARLKFPRRPMLREPEGPAAHGTETDRTTNGAVRHRAPATSNRPG